MKPLYAVLLLVLCIIVGTYIFFFEREPMPDPEDEQAEVKLVSLPVETVTRLNLTFQDGREIDFVIADEGRFAMTKPVQSRVDQELLQRILSTLCSLSAMRQISADADTTDDLYGFAEPQATVRVWQREKLVPLTLYFGRPNPVRYAVYVKIESDPAIAIVGDYVLKSFSLKTDEFRERVLVPSSNHDIEALEIVHPAGSLSVFTQADGSWWMNKPWNYRIDGHHIHSLITDIQEIRISSFIDDLTEAQPHLKTPAVRAMITRQGIKEASQLILGDYIAEKKQRVAHYSGDSFAALIDGQDIDAFLMTPESLFEKRIMPIRLDSVNRLLLTDRDNRTLTISRDPQNMWNEESSAEAAGETRRSAGNPDSLIDRINGLEAVSFMPEGLPINFDYRAKTTIVLESTDREETVTFAGILPGTECGVVLGNADVPPACIPLQTYKELTDMIGDIMNANRDEVSDKAAASREE